VTAPALADEATGLACRGPGPGRHQAVAEQHFIDLVSRDTGARQRMMARQVVALNAVITNAPGGVGSARMTT
jgi:hypothetical protein